MSDEITVGDINDYLEHHGVKGMKWGHHSAQTSGSGPARKSRAELKALDRQTRQTPRMVTVHGKEKNRVEQDKATLKARENLDQSYENFKAAKATYKQDKHQIGKVAAKRILNDHRSTYTHEVAKANRETHNEEVTRILKDLGDTLIKHITGTSPAEQQRAREAAQAQATARAAGAAAQGIYNFAKAKQSQRQSKPANGGHFTATPTGR